MYHTYEDARNDLPTDVVRHEDDYFIEIFYSEEQDTWFTIIGVPVLLDMGNYSEEYMEYYIEVIG